LKRNLVRWYVFLVRAVFCWRFCLVLDRFRDRDVFEVTQRHLFQRMSSAIVLFKVTVSELCVTVPILISNTVAVLIRSLIVKFVNLLFMFDRFPLVEIGKTRGWDVLVQVSHFRQLRSRTWSALVGIVVIFFIAVLIFFGGFIFKRCFAVVDSICTRFKGKLRMELE
jgi:hypothetical protein